MGKGQLPEKPWRTDAFIRLIASLFVCCAIGGVVSMVFRFFGEPHKAPAALFIALIVANLASFLIALFVLMRPWSIETLLQNLLISLFCIYGGLFFMWLAERRIPDTGESESTMATLIIGILSLQGAALVLVHFFLREHHTGWVDGFGFGNNSTKGPLLGVIVVLPVLLVAWGLQLVSTFVLQHLHFHPQEQETVQILQSTEGWQNRVAMGIATIIIAPVAEEILFRGIMYPAIKRIGYPRLAWWVTAIVFAAIHHNPATFVPLVFLAIVLIWLYEHTGNLLSCIVTHSLFNAVNFILVYVTQN